MVDYSQGGSELNAQKRNLTSILRAVAPGTGALLVALLMFPAVGVAFSDVVVDALMVEMGQPQGLTGVLQSVQWGAAYGATVIVGVVGGEMSRHGLQKEAFALCGGVTLLTAILVLFFVREERVERRGTGTAFREAVRGLWNAARSRVVLGVGAFLFLFYFNPFSFSLLYNHMTGALRFGEEVYGRTVSIGAVGSVAACLVFGALCRRLSLGALIHGSIVLGILSTLCYMALTTELSAYVIAAVAQFALMIATLVTLDLAARAVPPGQAGTMFALLMSLSNASPALSTGIGGQLYDAFRPSLGDAGAFRLLVAIGAAATALSWLLVPFLRRLPLEAREGGSPGVE